MKWPFNRNKDTASVPQEIQEYYQSERRERTGIAWLLALGTLLVTIILAILLFFAGRWLYRAITTNEDNKTGRTSEQAAQDQPAQTPPAENGAAPAPSPGTGSSSAPAAGSPSAPAQTPTSASGGLPNTGPGDVIGLFTATTVTAAAAHYAVKTRRRIQ